jgi:hypothetical protein
MLVAILHFAPAEDDPYGIVARLVDALPSGSFLVMSHATGDFWTPERNADVAAGRYGPFWPRPRADFARFFDGLELVAPGIVSIAGWRAENEPQPSPAPPRGCRRLRLRRDRTGCLTEAHHSAADLTAAAPPR